MSIKISQISVYRYSNALETDIFGLASSDPSKNELYFGPLSNTIMITDH